MELDATVFPTQIRGYPLIMNSVWSKTWPKESPKLLQMPTEFMHVDQHRLNPAQSLHDLKNAHFKQWRDERGIVSDDDSARFTLDRRRIPRTDSLADLVVNPINYWVKIAAESESLPGNSREIDVEFDAR